MGEIDKLEVKRGHLRAGNVALAKELKQRRATKAEAERAKDAAEPALAACLEGCEELRANDAALRAELAQPMTAHLTAAEVEELGAASKRLARTRLQAVEAKQELDGAAAAVQRLELHLENNLKLRLGTPPKARDAPRSLSASRYTRRLSRRAPFLFSPRSSRPAFCAPRVRRARARFGVG